MAEIDLIKRPVSAEMKEFERIFRDSMKSKVPLLDKITHYIVKRKGKQMRPLFIFLSAKMMGDITPSTYHAASLIELLHTATLVHDDVVDDAYERRGFFSINALWKNKVAVLVGDYLLSKGLMLAVEKSEFKLLELVTNAVKSMSEGELLQMEKARNLGVNEEVYFEIIKQKTAALIAACCATGVASGGADEATVNKAHEIGIDIGVAFQIKDDLFDYGLGTKVGKPVGIDIKEKKLTLPLIHALENVSRSEKRRIIKLIKNHHSKNSTVAEVTQFVFDNGGIDYATTWMNKLSEQAKSKLKESFTESEARDSLIRLVDYTINRTK
ncbi:MAG TPA: polyprenyl synthetase [Flavobacteriales bacterium]|jgi:octaprenyl-diphosphate synthase|nr:polyprenyl synthetase [Flavobacteriales bacterium]